MVSDQSVVEFLNELTSFARRQFPYGEFYKWISASSLSPEWLEWARRQFFLKETSTEDELRVECLALACRTMRLVRSAEYFAWISICDDIAMAEHACSAVVKYASPRRSLIPGPLFDNVVAESLFGEAAKAGLITYDDPDDDMYLRGDPDIVWSGEFVFLSSAGRPLAEETGGIEVPPFREGQTAEKAAPVLTTVQRNILAALDGKALTLDALEAATRHSRSTIYAKGGISELRDAGLVDNDRRIGGFFRPDRPPADAAN